MNGETIAAIATPPGDGGVAIIRISGPGAEAIAGRLFSKSQKLEHARMVFGDVKMGTSLLDQCYAVLFKAPHSYTGEDVLELHCHGGQVGVSCVLDAVLDNGARVAQPGEFTRRAFLNGKMDLSQAEAVGDFISASSEQSAKESLRQMEGELKREAYRCQDKLTDLLAQVEAAVEYPEEDIEPVVVKNVLPDLMVLKNTLEEIEASYIKGKLIKDGLDVTIAGKPNVGKSSLLNALTGVDRAIVTDVPGTTRDTIEHSYLHKGIRFNLIDTAGIRKTDDLIESEGVERSKKAINDGKCVVFVLDSTAKSSLEDEFVFRQIKKPEDDVLVVLNKLDLSQSLSEKQVFDVFGVKNCISVSAKTGEGLALLKEKLYERANIGSDIEQGLVITNARHREVVRNAAGQISDAIDALNNGMDMDCVTIDLNGAWQALGEITGKTVGEEIIDRIFEKFCLGK
ncbi:tRNA uridine-5-carboxymethylaminomethyl(34) synthesis GTPase MnmE [Christensenellaceae bacterium OttesenSCG-928-K19]|nr:tRNA uridine-5-carboxymethylaminomethyl(34) synthesis GTPase MnmE [Christensenellaceae bacterium OttesenSCG-928-K19]